MNRLKNLEAKLDISRDLAFRSVAEGDDPNIVKGFFNAYKLASNIYYSFKYRNYLKDLRETSCYLGEGI